MNYRKELIHLFKEEKLSADGFNQALTVTKTTPDASQWRHFLSSLFLWLGVLAITSSVLFFIAYNWDELGRFAKFGLVESLIAASIFVYWRANKFPSDATLSSNQSRHLIGKAALLLASLFLGVLLAFYGQTYQTGADTWQLFFTWAILILPWVFIARFPALWIVFVVLLNLSAIFYLQMFNGFLYLSEVDVMQVLALLNLSALIIWEVSKKRWQWLSESWATRLLALAGGIPLTVLVINFIDGRRHDVSIVSPLLWLIGMVLVYIIYRKRNIDLFMLAMACLSGMSVIIKLVSHGLFRLAGIDMGGFLLLAILVVILGGLSAKWLKTIHKESLEKRVSTQGRSHE